MIWCNLICRCLILYMIQTFNSKQSHLQREILNFPFLHAIPESAVQILQSPSHNGCHRIKYQLVVKDSISVFFFHSRIIFRSHLGIVFPSSEISTENPRASKIQSPFSTQVAISAFEISVGCCKSITASISFP